MSGGRKGVEKAWEGEIFKLLPCIGDIAGKAQFYRVGREVGRCLL